MQSGKHLAAEKKRCNSHNCAQSVVCTYCDMVGLPEQTAPDIAGAYRTGMGNREGTYLDRDNGEPNLFISSREDGRYDVRIGIFRLTSLDDGIGSPEGKGLSFTATDANGTSFEYTRQGDR